jgi:predicted ArsR family transcriptional regulator
MRDAGGLVRGVTVLDLCRELSWNGAKFRRALHELLAAGVVKSTYTPGLGRTYRLLGGTS